jgi:hypothetical protein
MTARALTTAAIAGALLAGCASIVGIHDLEPNGAGGEDGGSSSGGPEGGTGGSSGASSGGSSGSGSGSTSGSDASSSGSGSGSGSSGGSSSSGSGGSSGSSGGACNPPAGAACQIDPQCGCPAGEKCSFTTNPGATCVTAGGSVAGELCTADTQCATGLACSGGVCRPYCAMSGALCPAAATGPALGECINDPTVGAQDNLCLLPCTPSPNNCGTGQTCGLPTINGATYTNCVSAGSVPAGESCSDQTDCVAGTTCQSVDGEAICVQPCRTTMDCSNLSGTACDTTTDGFTVNGMLYGLCHS